MYQLIVPAFKFALYVVEQQNTKFKNNSPNNSIVCHADAYEVEEGGSITFYRTGYRIGDSQKKKIKIPVLSYPAGKWEACLLLDNHGNPSVFSSSGDNIGVQVPSSNSNHSNKQPSSRSMDDQDISDDLDSLDTDFSNSQTYQQGSSRGSTSLPTPSPNSWNNNSSNSIMNAISSLIPGVGNQHTTEEFKKAKNDFVESQIKEHVKNLSDKFDMQKFLIIINKESRALNLGKITETDIDWTASTLIRNKVILTKYFIDPHMQKILSLDIKDILKRQWEGKMGPIIQVLREREDTKNILAIDLAVWMVQNRFE